MMTITIKNWHIWVGLPKFIFYFWGGDLRMIFFEDYTS